VADSEREAALEFMNEPGEVPIERIEKLHGLVIETVQFFDADRLAIEDTGKQAAAGSAQIDRERHAMERWIWIHETTS
jgi:hypothetical protein